MNYFKQFRIAPGSKVDLSKVDAGFKDKQESHEHALPEIEAYSRKLHDLQYLMYAEGKRSLLICLQGRDAVGKDGTINHVLGAMNTQGCNVTAFMHEYLLTLKSDFGASLPDALETSQSLVPFDAHGDNPLFLLLVMGGAIWILMTYGAPLGVCLRSPVRGSRRWVFAAYYFSIQVPIYWVNASAWHLQYGPPDQPTNMLSLFGLQFVQPLLWFR